MRFHFFHKWSVWVVVQTGYLTQNGANIGGYTCQQSTCEICKKVRYRNVRQMF